MPAAALNSERGRMAASVLMVQGTTSHAGKSVLTAALCRIFARQGVRVAPFKAQNMALNSYVTAEGGEIGRAQAYQAAAAGIEPHVDMNPVLLKPNSETGCQVVVLGHPVGHKSVREYHDYQALAWPVVTGALDRLRRDYELVIIEGAGSPAEVNLRDRDIVNMRVARYADCPVLLVADIDRGGVFASLIGTTMLVTPEERGLIRGFVINKFRGDASLLDDGLDFLQKETGIPTLGVIPYMRGWRGDEEDSLGVEDRRQECKDADLAVAVVRLPYISNFTDFDALADEDDTAVRYAVRPDELRGADAIILPGAKSVIHDLEWLRHTGIAQSILNAAEAGTPIVGICGGYQMLGRRITDPDGVESSCPEIEGLGLLDVETVFRGEKRTVRVAGRLTGAALGDAGIEVEGYEIHMGQTSLGPNAKPCVELESADEAAWMDGAAGSDGQICGTYIHGIFDRPEFRRGWLNRLRSRKGLPPISRLVTSVSDIDRLADHFRSHLDMAFIESLIAAPGR